MTSTSRFAVPRSVQAAAALFLVYGAATVVHAAALQSDAGWVGPGAVPRALVELVAAAVIAGGLLRGARWGWWLGLGFGVVWFVLAALPVLVFDEGDLWWLPPSGYQLLLAGAMLSLGGAIALLLSPSARAAFRARSS